MTRMMGTAITRNRSIHLVQRPLLYHLLGWLLVFVLTVLFFGFLMPWAQAVTHTLVHLALVIGVFYFNANWLIPRYIGQNQWGQYWFMMGLVFVATTAVRSYIVQAMHILPPLSTINLRGRQVFFPVITTLIILFISTVYQLLRNQYDREKHHLAIINEQNEAQLQALRAQINPHFLFNTLNNIYALAVAKSDTAPTMILRLSELLRYVIYDSQRKRVSLSREADQCQRFIDLFQMRYPTPRSIDFSVEGDLTDKSIEPMILIPLVENCFKHGDFDLNEQAFAQFRLSVVGAQVHFAAANTFNPADQQKDQVGGVGLANIHRRLALNYPGAYQLEYQAQQAIFTVSLRLSV